MDQSFHKEVRPLLDLIDSLRQFGVQNEISLPQIAVMGDQSSGKSSVLESISGIPFPRGSGLVTRCPTELIMCKSSEKSPWRAEISLSWSKPQPPESGIAESIDDLSHRMAALAETLCNSSANGFSQERIVIKLSSPESPDLTIIDLPGIVRTSTLGQDIGVVQQVNDLIETYIALPNTIILAVVPCNQDIATVDILERASIFDPSGVRTIGVLTKPDLVGEGGEDEVVQVLLNIRKPLQLGYIMLKNPSQKALKEGRTSAEARKEEMSFFSEHPVFSQHLDKNLFGVTHLVTHLSKLLAQTIRRSIPGLIADLKILLQQTREEISQLGTEMPSEFGEQHALLVKKINTYCQLMRHSSRGEYRDREGLFSSREDLRLHALVQRAYTDLQHSILDLRPVGNDELDAALSEKLQEEIQMQHGRELPGFINSQAFYAYIIKLVEEWRPLVEDCKSLIIINTQRVSASICALYIREYPELCTALQIMTARLIEDMGTSLGAKIEALIAREQSPYTSQDVLLQVVNGIRFRTFDSVLRQVLDTTDFKGVGVNRNSMREDFKKRLGNWYMLRHGVDAQGSLQEMSTLIQAYWDIASRRLVDNVCMCIEREFSDELVRSLQSQCVLFGLALSPEKVKELLQEDLLLSGRRKHLQERVQVMQTSLTALFNFKSEHWGEQLGCVDEGGTS